MIKLTQQAAQQLIEKGMMLIYDKDGWYLPPFDITFRKFDDQPLHDMVLHENGTVTFTVVKPAEESIEVPVPAAVPQDDEQLLKYESQAKVAE